MKMPGAWENVSVLKKEILVRREACLFLGVTAFALLTAVGAYLRIPLPFTPVPVTLQVFFVLLCAATLGPVYGTISQLLYIGLGIAGLPMFTLVGAGFSHLLGPTGGYILGFVAAQALAGFIIHRGGISSAGPLRIAIGMAVGIIVIYTFGVVHLKIVTGESVRHAITLGALPFIPADMAKAVAALLIVSGTKKRIAEIF
jgi:biotin transport system substrate-specific component